MLLATKQLLPAENEIHLFKSETEFWFDLKYDFLVQKTTLLTWWSWYISWHKRTMYSQTLPQLLFNKYLPIACPKMEKESESFCRNKLRNQITQQLARTQRPVF